MNRIFFRILVISVGLITYLSCAQTPQENSSSSSSSSSSSATSGIEMPEQITMEVPNSLKNENELKLKAPGLFRAGSTEVQSQAAGIIKMYVSWGLGITKFIDMVLSNVYENREYLAAHMGEEIPAGDGKFILNTNSEGVYYLYLIKTNGNLTNIYLDWQKANGAFKGRVKFVSDTNSDTKEATIIYDYTVSQPYLDIYIMFKQDNSDGISNFRVTLTRVGEGEVIAKSKVDINPAVITNHNSFISSWNLVGYGSENGNGGVYARTTSINNGTNWANFTITGTNYITNQVTNFTIIGVGVYYITNIFTFSNYTYEEYFNSSGNLLWNLARVEGNYKVYNRIFTTNYISISQLSNQLIYTTNIILITNLNVEITNHSSTTIFVASTPETTNIYQIYEVYEEKHYSNIQIVDPNICNTNGTKPSLLVELTNIAPLDSAEYTNITLP
ncbi:MAG: hypothetical protein ACP5QT_02175 [Brevinematia bacterium]